jgi:hypothetical protein
VCRAAAVLPWLLLAHGCCRGLVGAAAWVVSLAGGEATPCRCYPHHCRHGHQLHSNPAAAINQHANTRHNEAGEDVIVTATSSRRRQPQADHAFFIVYSLERKKTNYKTCILCTCTYISLYLIRHYCWPVRCVWRNLSIISATAASS